MPNQPQRTAAFAAVITVLSCLSFGLLTGCSDGKASVSPPSTPTPVATVTPTPAPVPGFTYKVVRAYPHDRAAFVQGLLVDDGVFYESTGLEGQSSLRRVEISTGKVQKKVEVPAQYFAEGLAELNDKLYQLTWQNNTGFIYDQKTLEKIGEFSYTGEGWGLTTDGTYLILSDGTSRIRFLDPATFEEKRYIEVTDDGMPLSFLNELEYIKGEIYANVWKTNGIVKIDPATGRVVGRIDMTGLLPESERAGTDVLNGIAYDKAGDRLFITGKLWPRVYEVKLIPD